MKQVLVFLCLILCISCAKSVQQEQKIKSSSTDTVSISDTTKSTQNIVFQMVGELTPTNYIDPYHLPQEKVDSICLPYGFTVKRMSGCDLTPALYQSVEQNNQKARQMMLDQHGKNWKNKFEQETNYKLSF